MIVFRRVFERGIPILLLLGLLVWAPGCGEPEPAGPGRTVGSRAGLSSSGDLPPPRIELSALEHDFGVLRLGDQPSAHFTFRNTGDSLLFIRKVRSS